MKVTWGATVEGYGLVVFLKRDTDRVLYDANKAENEQGKQVKRRKASEDRIKEELAKPRIQGNFEKKNFVGQSSSASGAMSPAKEGGGDNTIRLKMQ